MPLHLQFSGEKQGGYKPSEVLRYRFRLITEMLFRLDLIDRTTCIHGLKLRFMETKERFRQIIAR